MGKSLLTLVLVLFAAVGAWADEVNYLDENGVLKQVEATALTGSIDYTTITTGWYYVTGNVNYEASFLVQGDVHLILVDGCYLESHGGPYAVAGIEVELGNSLSIYAQSTGEDAGTLFADGGYNCAGIGATRNWGRPNNGNITINGGFITALGNVTVGAPGIGGEGSATVTINGGVVNATAQVSNTRSSGIRSGNVIITGGVVTATGISPSLGIAGNCQVTGGNVISNGNTTFTSDGSTPVYPLEIITGKAGVSVEIASEGYEAETDAAGNATIWLPSSTYDIDFSRGSKAIEEESFDKNTSAQILDITGL